MGPSCDGSEGGQSPTYSQATSQGGSCSKEVQFKQGKDTGQEDDPQTACFQATSQGCTCPEKIQFKRSENTVETDPNTDCPTNS